MLRSSVSDAVLKAAWVNCRLPLHKRYGMKDSTPSDWIAAYHELGTFFLSEMCFLRRSIESPRGILPTFVKIFIISKFNF